MTKKIVAAACRIAAGNRDKLHLGNISIQRDWGWAPEYVEAMWLILQQDQAEDFVIPIGKTHKLEEFVEPSFSCVGLDWHDNVVIDPDLFRPTDLNVGKANPIKAHEKLGWRTKYAMKDVVRMMVEAEQRCAND